MKKIILLCVGFILVAPVAFAQDQADFVDECQADRDCPTQFVCDTFEMPCEATPCTCACEPCPDEADGCGCTCPACEVAECTDQGQFRMCVWEPVACVSDEDCADGFECVTEEMCSGGIGCECPPCACDPASDVPCDCTDYECECGDVTEPVCEPGESHCLPKQVQCVSDSDCADGFSCVSFGADIACMCDCACPACEGDACMPCECEPCDCGDVTGYEDVSYCLPADWSEYVDYEGGEMVMEPRQNGDVLIAIDDESDSGATANPPGETDADESDSGNCSAGCSGNLSIILLLPFAALLFVRRRPVRG